MVSRFPGSAAQGQERSHDHQRRSGCAGRCQVESERAHQAEVVDRSVSFGMGAPESTRIVAVAAPASTKRVIAASSGVLVISVYRSGSGAETGTRAGA